MALSVKYFDYPLQFNQAKEEYLKIIEETFCRGAYILGDDLKAFEESLADFVGCGHAVGVKNCTDALLLSLIAAGVGRGDEVISVAHTFVATIEVICFLGARPVFVDVAEDHNMNVALVEKAITPKTKAIVPVSLNGRICSNLDDLVALAAEHNVAIIEDAAQSLGARYKDKGAGTFGLSGAFSFYPAKLLGAFGDAGAVVTNDPQFARRIAMLRNHGRSNGTDIEMWGLNCRLDTIHAAILNHKLAKLPGRIDRRRAIATIYGAQLRDVPQLALPAMPGSEADRYDVFQNYEVEAQARDRLVTFLRDRQIESALPWGGKAVHQFPGLRLGTVRLPRTEELFRRVLMLPMYPELTDDQVLYTCDAIKTFYRKDGHGLQHDN